MANYSLADVKMLRDRLGAGMLDSKNALVEADGDIEKADRDPPRQGPEGRREARRPHDDRRSRHRQPADNGAATLDRARQRDRLRREERRSSSLSPRRCSTRSPPPVPTDVAAGNAATAGRQDRRRVHRRRGRAARREGRAPHGRAGRGHRLRHLPAQDQPRTCRRRSASSSATPVTTPRPLAPIAQHIAFADPKYLTPRRGSGRRGRARARHRRPRPRRTRASPRPLCRRSSRVA